MKKFFVPIIGFVLLFALLGYALIEIRSGDMSPREIPSPLVGKPLPEFKLADLQRPEKTYTKKDFAGKVFLLNIWASWCVACREEHPLLKVLPKQEGVPLIGVDYKDKNPDGLAFLKEMGDPYDLIMTDNNGRYGIDLGVYGVPETFVVDHNGIIRYKQIGPITLDAWHKKIVPMVRQLQLEASSAATPRG